MEYEAWDRENREGKTEKEAESVYGVYPFSASILTVISSTEHLREEKKKRRGNDGRPERTVRFIIISIEGLKRMMEIF